MKKTLIRLVLGLLLGFKAEAANIDAVQDLSFGTLIPEASSGIVTISTSGTIDTGGSVSLAPSGDSYFQGKVKFTPNMISVFKISVDDSEITLTNEKGGMIKVTNFTVNPSDVNVSILQPFYVSIGGQMQFTSASSSGTYVGAVTVRVTRILGFMTVQLPVRVVLWDRLSVEETSPLSFGTMEVNTGSSVIRISPESGNRSVVSGSGNVILDSASSVSNAQFDIHGQANASLSLSLPNTVSLIGSGGSEMMIDHLTSYPSGTSFSLDATGHILLSVGGDLNIANNQPSGSYEGTYTLSVNY